MQEEVCNIKKHSCEWQVSMFPGKVWIGSLKKPEDILENLKCNMSAPLREGRSHDLCSSASSPTSRKGRDTKRHRRALLSDLTLNH